MNETTTVNSKIGRQTSGYDQQLNRRIKLVTIALAVVVLLFLAMILVRYFQSLNAPARSYFDFQTSVWKVEISRNPQKPGPHINLGAIYTKMGETDKAFNEFELAIKLDKSNPVPWYYLGLLNKKIGNKAEAISNQKQAVKLAAPEGRFLPLFELGKMYESDKKYSQAAKFYERSVADQAMMWNTHYQLAKLYEKLGEKDPALREYKEAKKFNQTNKKIQAAIDRLSK